MKTIKIIKVIQVLCIILLLSFLTGYIYSLCITKTEYHIQLLDYDQVELRDGEDNLIKTTTLDSLSYYLEQDNL
jgi:hypothetical protein